MGYDYGRLTSELETLCEKYPFAEVFGIGESEMGKTIYCVKIGCGPKKLFINAVHHGLEYITGELVMKFILSYARQIAGNGMMYKYSARSMYRHTSLYAVPMVNPDGAELAIHGLNLQNSYHRRLVKAVGTRDFGRVWQSNINGVDLNHNYDALWQPVKQGPCESKYGGTKPLSEKETQAIVSFTESMGFDMVIAYHSQGREIYYDFNGIIPEESYKFGVEFARLSGYKLAVPTGSAAFGGYKDWFIQRYNKPAYTIEVGKGKNPLPDNMIEEIYSENMPVIAFAMNYL